MFNKTQENLQPYMDFGAGTLPYLNAFLGIGGEPTTQTTTAAPVASAASSANPLTASSSPSQAFTPWGVPLVKGANIATASQLQQPTTTTAAPTTSNVTTGGMNSAVIQAALEKLPGYQFTKTQGLKAVQNLASSKGLGVSGSAIKGAADYVTGLADSTYGNQFNRFMDAAKLGQASAAGQATNSTNAAGNIASTIQGGGNAWGNAFNNAGNAGAQGLYANNLSIQGTNNAIAASRAANPDIF
jgi:hypothetical protein